MYKRIFVKISKLLGKRSLGKRIFGKKVPLGILIFGKMSIGKIEHWETRNFTLLFLTKFNVK